MATKRVATAEAVHSAISECDQLGRAAFLRKYGYWEAKQYFLIHDGRRYDSKAVYGVAYGYAHPEEGALRPGQFSGGEKEVARRLKKLGFTVESGVSGATHPPTQEDVEAVVLTTQEATIGGEYDFWDDVIGEQYHFPNRYRRLVERGRRFVYYRGVRRKGGVRGRPEYFGTGRIGEVWRDPDDNASKKSERRWYCSIEEYTQFRNPVSWEQNGVKLERIKPNQFRDGARSLPLSTFRRITDLAGLQQSTRRNPRQLPQLSSVAASRAADLLRVPLPESRVSWVASNADKQPSHRSRRAKELGDRAEDIVVAELTRQGMVAIRHVARLGEFPGYDIEYGDRGRTVRVEVKGTTACTFGAFELTEGERIAALRYGADYNVWLVARVASTTPVFEVISNIGDKLERGTLSHSPLLWRIERTNA